jgi:hypothetical protein
VIGLVLGAALWLEYVRVTFYTSPGVMFNGETVHQGAAACSDWMPIGTQLRLPDGFVVTCKDRGLGDRYWKGWIDIWAPTRAWGVRYVEADYGLYAWVEVVRWGDTPIEIEAETEE